ncbi:30S ribosomal protein S20 [Desulfitibacter alkalitolerans]|uniref:30S ribosomal protein S20 n=1 Tax=Desulfitibacter alkalitolerans TaxID=264641 RepID=UPI0004838D5B|nr:30S ribosomal protein S20 [Desulfitibacter alkalitolerans]
MPNIKSAKKRLEVSRRNNLRNSAAKSAIKTAIKRFESAVAGRESEQAQAAYKNMVKTLDKAVTKGFLHKNTAARKKSRLSKNLKALIS